MNTYGFIVSMGWIGGSGVVMADTKEEAVAIANAEILKAQYGKPELIKEEDLIDIKPNTAVLLTDGNY
jgi:hypothetical protein